MNEGGMRAAKSIFMLAVLTGCFALFLQLVVGYEVLMPAEAQNPESPTRASENVPLPPEVNRYPRAILAGGCFWCLESELEGRKGVVYTRVGYIGGDLEHPEYRDITTGKTGHAEAVEIYYDPEKLSYEELLNIFFRVSQ